MTVKYSVSMAHKFDHTKRPKKSTVSARGYKKTMELIARGVKTNSMEAR